MRLERTTDNNCGGHEVQAESISDLAIIANKKISQLLEQKSTNLLIFPNDLKQYGDEIDQEMIFSLEGSTLKTGNIMGFVGINNTQLTIQSRFTKNTQDYFLHYMLQKVLAINLFDLKHSTASESIFDFLLYLFPYYLKKALRQGLYKEYSKREYNNSNVQGTININKHLKKNIPFIGNVAYSVREHHYDNKITQLLRHTIELIKQHKLAKDVLNTDIETQNFVRTIIKATPSYNYNQRTAILNKNTKPFRHPYFYEYTELQKICIQILKYKGLKYGTAKDQIYGLLFDGAWLWEEYLSTFLIKCGFKHPRNKSSTEAIYLLESNKYPRYPDFWKENFILDAKYKQLENRTIDRNDMHQIISYMYIKSAKLGGFIFPSQGENKQEHIGKLNGYAGKVSTWGLSIPQQAENFTVFCDLMRNNEAQMLELLTEQ